MSMSFQYTVFFSERDKGNIDLVTDDIRVLLVMGDSTAGTDRDAATIAAIETLDEYDGAGYPATFATRKALTGKSITKDDPNHQSVFDADDPVYASLGPGTRSCVGAVLYKHGTSDADSMPIRYINDGGFPFAGDGENTTIQWPGGGIWVSKNA
jgi:hypothetical protein